MNGLRTVYLDFHVALRDIRCGDVVRLWGGLNRTQFTKFKSTSLNSLISWSESWLTWPGVLLVDLLDQAPDMSHSLQAATTLATSSAEPPTFCNSQKCFRFPMFPQSRTMVLVEKEAISSPSSSMMKAVGTAVWVVESNTPKAREMSPVLSSTSGMVRFFREATENSLKWAKRYINGSTKQCLPDLWASMESVEMATMRQSLPSKEEASARRKLVDTGKKSPWTLTLN